MNRFDYVLTANFSRFSPLNRATDSTVLLISLVVSGIVGSPQRFVRDLKDQKLVGQATNLLATKVLKGGVENEKNFVFSPLGLSTILTILGEGAGEETSNDLTTFFKYPSDRETVRAGYRKLLDAFQGNDPHLAPQFRTWFYIYKNNTVEDEYRKLIADNYFVDVKEIERDYIDPESTTVKESATTAAPQLLKNLDSSGKNNSKDIIEFDELKAESEPVDETRIDAQKDASKFDEVVEDRQYEDVPKQGEIKVLTGENEQNAVDVNLSEEKGPKIATEQTPKETIEKKEKVDEPEKFSLPLKQFEEMEIMQAQESRLAKAFAGRNDGDGASVISGNSIVGEKENAEGASEEEKYESKMLLFNGLYYRGNWQTPFQVSSRFSWLFSLD